MSTPNQVRIVEVGPRDGLQNEATIVSTEDKIRFVEMLVDAGLVDIEVSSFVSPKRVPQLADASAVFAGLPSWDGVRLSALVPNARGLERAIEARVRHIAFFTAASETFTEKNIGMTIGESLDEFRAMLPHARARGLTVRAYVSTAFVCPYEGKIPPENVAPVVRELVEMGVDEVSLGDTIGHAEPADVDALLAALTGVLPIARTALHFHDTHGTALDNVRAGLAHGVAVYDSSTGGTGGCPFAPGAAGNLATESLVSMLDGMGIETGVDVDRVIAAAHFIHSRLVADN